MLSLLVRFASAALVALASLLAAGPAAAAYYTLIAQAGGASDVATDLGDDTAIANYLNEGVNGSESYSAQAGGGGSLNASAVSMGSPPFAGINHRSAARIEETIQLDVPPFPTGPVTVTLGMVADVQGDGAGGSTASANAGVQLEPNSMSCSVSISSQSGTGGSCPGGTVDGTSVTRTFTLQELSNRSWEIDIAAQVEARTELFALNGSGTALATASLFALVSGEGVDYVWTGTGTNIPAPEPDAGAAVAIVCLAAAAYRVRAR